MIGFRIPDDPPPDDEPIVSEIRNVPVPEYDERMDGDDSLPPEERVDDRP